MHSGLHRLSAKINISVNVVNYVVFITLPVGFDELIRGQQKNCCLELLRAKYLKVYVAANYSG